MSQQTPSQQRASAVVATRGGSTKIEKAADPRRALARLVPYLKPYKTKVILVAILIVSITFLDLLGPYLIGRSIDQHIEGKELGGLAQMALILLIVYISNNAFQTLSSWTMAGVSQHALKDLRRDLFEHLQNLPLKYFDTHPAGEMMSRLTNDIEAVNQAVSQNVIAMLGSLLSLVGFVVAMFVLNFWLALASVIVVPIMIWFTNFIARSTRKGFRELQKSLGELNGVMEESISGQRVVRAFRRNESAIENFSRVNGDVFRAGVYANTYAMMLMPLTNQLGNLFVIVLAGLGGWLALQGLVSVGIIVTFISYAHGFVQPLRQLANIYNAIQAALAGAERVFEVMNTSPEQEDAEGAVSLEHLKGHVEFRDVDFAYETGHPIIKKMTLEALPGQTIALVGPTGAGKTTITNLLTRFYDIDGGSIRIDGHDLRDIRRADLRRELGLVLQDTFMFADTVMENIRYGRLSASDEEVIEAAKLADADHFIRQLPNGYQTLLSERAANLSQGQRQMLAIARAVLADPGILILDEATSSVDTRTEVRIQQALLKLMEGRTSFVIAHRLSTIRDADQVLVIKDGEIIERGKHSELLAMRGFFYQLYMSQFKGNAI
ncbi:MAG: multidrug ABC transporter ATP-binding protein [Chloroflexi bacterium HGW-Chloroflexi-6]|nr:MAG: multidrug ABC transporter ATP-binding protein [Chloroflexi bacterium HGW-Chloroflexi-6]